MVSGSAQLVGGEVRVAGVIGRKLWVAGAVVVLAGEVAGNVEVVAQEIEVLPTARIRGKLVYWSPRPARPRRWSKSFPRRTRRQTCR